MHVSALSNQNGDFMLFRGKPRERRRYLAVWEIERAIASLHGVTEQSSGIFRGRLRHFQKSGLCRPRLAAAPKSTMTLKRRSIGLSHLS